MRRYELGTILEPEQKKAIQLTPQRMWMESLYKNDMNKLLKEIAQQQQQMQTSIDAVQTTTMTIQESA